jgi:hypothetical protein
VFSCVVGLDAETAGIFLVALGTSLPDTFASILAIKHEHNADNAVGNVTGSNSVNVFLGLGMPWLFASIHWWMVWPPGWRDEDPQCIELETCTSSKTGPLWDRQEWLKKYQGLSAGPDSSRPPEYQLLLKYADTSEKKQAQAVRPSPVGGCSCSTRALPPHPPPPCMLACMYLWLWLLVVWRRLASWSD